MNKVILLGRLTKDPEIRLTQNENKAAKFTLAVNRRFVKDGEERQADFFNIVTFSKQVEFVEKFLKQGTQIILIGRLQNRNWEDENGQKHYITEIITEEIYFADSIKKHADENILNSKTPYKEEQEESEFPAGDDLPF